MKSADFLDALQRTLGVKSDRKLAARLGWTHTRLSKYRTGAREFDDATCAAVAEVLDLSPAYVIAEIQAERADCTEVKREWQAVARMLKAIRTQAAALALLGMLILGGAPESSQAAGASAPDQLYLIRIRRWLRRLLFGKSPLNRSGGTVTRNRDFSDHKREIGRMRASLRHVPAPALAVTCLLFGGCAGTSADLMAGTKVRDGGFYGSGPTLTLRVRQQLTARTWCEYEHVSHLLVGPPFGPKHEEDSLDQVGCGISFGRRP